MNQLTVYTNQFDASENRSFESSDVLRDFYTIKKLKTSARLYVDDVSQANDITPVDLFTDQHVLTLSKQNRSFFIVERAALDWAFSTWLAWEAINYTNDLIIDALMPDIPEQEAQKQSANNALGDRGNTQRLGQRVPEILGQVRGYPDLIYPNFKYFENRREIEESVMCLGRGKYLIEDIKEGDTDIEQIVGTSVSIYAPGESLIAESHQLRYGDKFEDLPPIAKKSASTNGQTLLAPSSERINKDDIYFEYPNKITSTSSSVRSSMASAFESDELIDVLGASFGIAPVLISGSAFIDMDFSIALSTNTKIQAFNTYTKIRINAFLVNDPVNGNIDLSGEYEISALSELSTEDGFSYEIKLVSPDSINQDFGKITARSNATLSGQLFDSTEGINLDATYTVLSTDSAVGIYLSTPSTVNSDWLKLQQLPNMNTSTTKANITLMGSLENAVGWFESYDRLTTESWYNFFAANGIYRQQDNGSPSGRNVSVQVEVQQINDDGVPVGDIQTVADTMIGENSRDALGLTIKVQHGFEGPYRFRVKRTSKLNGSNQVIEEVKIREAYSVYYAEKHIYDDETIVRARTIATESALSTKERKLNMLATRLLKVWRNDAWIDDQPSKNVADILIAVAMDSKIGRRKEAEINIDEIHAEVEKAVSYFGTENAMQFCGTFDSLNQSFQEACFAISEPCHLTPSRSGNKLQVSFESKEDLPVLLFNFRNKVPKSHNQTLTFGVVDDHDGVIVKWSDPKNGDIETSMYIPDQNIVKPKTLSFVGIRNKEQAHFVGWRAWLKLKYIRKSIEFQALREADLLARKDVILLSDTRSSKYFGGEVKAQNGLEIKLSHAVNFDSEKNYVLHVQLADESVDAIAITKFINKKTILIERAPSLPLTISDDENQYQFNALYQIAESDQQKAMLFRVESKSPASKTSSTVTVSNFDERVYEHDQDYISNLI